jgi:hypothetical protein
MVPIQIAARQYAVNEVQAGFRSIRHSDRHGPVQFHNRGGLDECEPIV